MRKYIDVTWDFRNSNTKKLTHCFHIYPAIMIPQVAGTLIDKYGENAKILFDPYCGSGTSLVEANVRGIDAIGTDLNPLAKLISEVKTTSIDIGLLDISISKFENYLIENNLTLDEWESNYPVKGNIDFWFTEDVKSKLGIIKHFILNLKEEDLIKFFKVAFSETIREVSLTRNGEFKLYRIEEQKIKDHKPDVFKIIVNKLLRNRNGLYDFIKINKSKANSVVYDFNTVDNCFYKIIPKNFIDIIVTSPPYGDSRTTVAYGQFSRLSLEWLGINNSKNIDNILMGNSKKLLQLENILLNTILYQLNNIDRKRALEVEYFYSDYYSSISNVATRMKKNGFAIYVVGNRRVKGIELPTDEITKSFFEINGFEHIETIVRNIPNKRMPSRNSPTNEVGVTGSTMINEYIVVMQKK